MQRIKILFLWISILTLSAAALYSRNSDFTWGVSVDAIKQTIPAGKDTSSFYADEKPQYKNRILRHILTVDPTLEKNAMILRVNSEPVTDYLFIKGKLYSVMESHESITAKGAGEIEAELKRLYGAPSVKEEGNEFIYAFTTSNTRVLFYVKKDLDGRIKSKVYYYPKKLFMMLISP